MKTDNMTDVKWKQYTGSGHTIPKLHDSNPTFVLFVCTSPPPPLPRIVTGMHCKIYLINDVL